VRQGDISKYMDKHVAVCLVNSDVGDINDKNRNVMEAFDIHIFSLPFTCSYPAFAILRWRL